VCGLGGRQVKTETKMRCIWGVGGTQDEGTETGTRTGFRFMILSLVVDSTGSRKGRMAHPHERDAKISLYGIFELGMRKAV
jgi:hypothetical protein